jgi:tetratricopeptide (TPR) repeat protein
VTPVAAAQLVLFWNMAIISASSAPFAVRTIELLAPILGAFLCAHALAPEQGQVGELVFVRPVSLERVLMLRMAAILAFVVIAMSPVLIFYWVKVEAFPLAATVLAAIPPMLFLSVLAIAAASALRQPLFGFAAAGAFWAVDLATGGHYNQLLTLDSFADLLSGRPMSDVWVTNKLLLIGLAALVYLWLRRRLGQPVAPRRWRGVVARAAAVLVIAVAYLGGGAGYKIGYGLQHERDLGTRAHLWYQIQFGGYGALPVARLFGPAFPLYVQADLSSGGLAFGDANTPVVGPVDIGRLRELLRRYPKSIWADNAQFEIAVRALKRRAAEPALLIGRLPGQDNSPQQVLDQDLPAARREFELLVDRYPGSAFGPLALSQLAAIGLSELDFSLAISSYERLIRDYPDTTDAYPAGLKLSHYYLASAQPEKALQAAHIAAGAAVWDVEGEALLAAARAAQAAGRDDAARDRYRRARQAARLAAERSLAGARSPSRLNKAELFTSTNAVIEACDRALAGGRSTSSGASPRPPAAPVSGRVLRGDQPAAGARVALGRADERGFPSPFAGPTAEAGTDEHGRFALTGIPEGEYPALAVWLRMAPETAELRKTLTAPPLPVKVAPPLVDLGDIRVTISRPVPLATPATRGNRSFRSPGQGERPGEGLPTRTMRRGAGGRRGRG